MAQHVVTVDQSGLASFIYSDELSRCFPRQNLSIRRASAVEPTEDARWTADMAPVGGPLLGPFDERSQALAAEVLWLEQNLLGDAGNG